MKKLIEHFTRNKSFYQACLDAIGAIAFFVMIALFCWLCCACSGYHWE